MQTLQPHELANFYPMHDKARFAELVEGMKQSGYRDEFPIVVHEGKILDGRNRYAAAIEAGVEPFIVQFSGDDPVEFVVQANSNRRDLEVGQRYLIYKDLMAEKLRREGLLRMSAGGKNKQESRCDNIITPSKTRDEIAKHAGVSTGTAAIVDYVEARSPELIQKIKSGEVTPSEAKKIIQREEIKANHAAKRSQPIPDGKYQVIYADPPWQYENSGFNESAESQYPTMPLDDICTLPISGLAENNTVLFLWATNPLLQEGLTVLKAWGFEYKTNIAWVKDRGRGKGWFLKSKHELLLIGVRSNTPQPAERPDSAQEFERGKVHSRKPVEFYELIESMYPEGKKIELFSRIQRDGWTAWGNEW